MNILLTPARIGPAEIPNRIVMPPMTTRGSDAEGNVSDQTVAYYMALVRGGTGLITVEMASPEKAGALVFSSVTMRIATFGPTPGARETAARSCEAFALARPSGVSVDRSAS